MTLWTDPTPGENPEVGCAGSLWSSLAAAVKGRRKAEAEDGIGAATNSHDDAAQGRWWT